MPVLQFGDFFVLQFGDFFVLQFGDMFFSLVTCLFDIMTLICVERHNSSIFDQKQTDGHVRQDKLIRAFCMC